MYFWKLDFKKDFLKNWIILLKLYLIGNKIGKYILFVLRISDVKFFNLIEFKGMKYMKYICLCILVKIFWFIFMFG